MSRIDRNARPTADTRADKAKRGSYRTDASSEAQRLRTQLRVIRVMCAVIVAACVYSFVRWPIGG